MSGPTYEDINAMRRLREILNGAEQTTSSKAYTESRSNTKANKPISSGRPEVDAMANVLKRFHAATDNTAERLVENAENSPVLQEAMQTRKTENGAIIGKWEVRVRISEAENKARKIYDVVDPMTKDVVQEGLVIFEAAHAIVKYLNKGYNIANNKIVTVLDLEETYNRNRIDAMRFKHRYERCKQLNEREAGEVFASRFQVARANALAAQDQIKSILLSIR